ncbi:ABC transporter substrate-binding protein [Actinocorallia longicatena]|uniref:Spermidine/putrescine ABC transporter substrate-binding protein n=1 Tax=Actinocorallia longicatena TaxID=111803 RepID=A0ABP6PYR7_9ACTN
MSRGAMDAAFRRGLTRPRASRRDFLKLMGAAGIVAGASACSIPGQGGRGSVTQAQIDAFWKGKVKNGKLNWANWPGYMQDDHYTIKQFEKQTGVSVEYKEAIQEAGDWFGKIQAPLAANQSIGFDLMVITNGVQLSKCIQLGYLAPLDHKQLPNFDKYSGLKNPAYDPGNAFTVPYQSGITGIAYNTKYVKDPITSIKQLWDPKYKGKVGMMADSQELANFGLFYLGIDPEKSTEADWNKAAEVLKQQRPLVRKYYQQDYIDAVAKGDVYITQAWSGDIFSLANEDVKFVVPAEGGTIWTDNMCLPKTAANPVDALMMANFLFDPVNQGPLEEFINYVTPVPGARDVILKHAAESTGEDKQTLEDLANSPLVFPSAEDMKKLKTYRTLDNTTEPVFQKIFQPIAQGA